MAADEGAKEGDIQEILIRNMVHVGSKIKVEHMRRFIFKLRPDGVYLMDVNRIVERLNIAARFISLFQPEKVVVVASHVYSIKPASKFCEMTGAIPIMETFMPGLFTNRVLPSYMEPNLLLATDPRYDAQAITEASIAGIPVIAMCSTDNLCENVDLVIPVNNRGRTSLACAFWYLARQVMAEKGQLTPEVEKQLILEDFMAQPITAKTE